MQFEIDGIHRSWQQIIAPSWDEKRVANVSHSRYTRLSDFPGDQNNRVVRSVRSPKKCLSAFRQSRKPTALGGPVRVRRYNRALPVGSV